MTNSEEQTVFVVDDDAAVCDSIAELVESVGLKAEVYASALAFLEAFQPERPGCLVLDHLLVGRANFRLGSSLHAHAGQ